jgi:hypothetical protein
MLIKAHNWQPMTISDRGTWVGSVGTVARWPNSRG